MPIGVAVALRLSRFDHDESLTATLLQVVPKLPNHLRLHVVRGATATRAATPTPVASALSGLATQFRGHLPWEVHAQFVLTTPTYESDTASMLSHQPPPFFDPRDRG